MFFLGPSSLIPVVVHDGLDNWVGVGGELPEAETVLRPRRLELELPRRPQEGVLVQGALRDEDVAGRTVRGGSAVLTVRNMGVNLGRGCMSLILLHGDTSGLELGLS